MATHLTPQFGAQIVIADKTMSDFLYQLITNRINWSVILLCLLVVSPFSNTFAATLPKESFGISHNDYSEGDLSIGGLSIYGRKTLQSDTLSLKLNYQDLAIEDKYQDQIANAPSYSETQTILSTGLDYLYYDSTLSLNSEYSTVESTGLFDIGLEAAQEFNNGMGSILMGFSHGWEDDSDLGLHNKQRKFHIGNNIKIRPTWMINTTIEFASSDGDLENFQSARRFNNTKRTQLPSGKSDQVVKFMSSNDLGRNFFVNSEFDLFKNDWGQSGQNIEINFLRVRSEKLAVKTHFRISNQDESKYFVESVISPTQSFYSDHRSLSKQDTKEFGLTGQWKFKPHEEKRFNNLRLDLGYTFIKHTYAMTDKISNSGHLLHLNFSGNY